MESIKAEARSPQIVEQLNDQDKLLSKFSDLVKQLEDKLNTITRNDEETWNSINEAPETPLVEIANELRNNNHRIESKIFSIESLINRIEL